MVMTSPRSIELSLAAPGLPAALPLRCRGSGRRHSPTPAHPFPYRGSSSAEAASASSSRALRPSPRSRSIEPSFQAAGVHVQVSRIKAPPARSPSCTSRPAASPSVRRSVNSAWRRLARAWGSGTPPQRSAVSLSRADAAGRRGEGEVGEERPGLAGRQDQGLAVVQPSLEPPEQREGEPSRGGDVGLGPIGPGSTLPLGTGG